MKLAFFDDYDEVQGHHPDYIISLGQAANAPIYCPEAFLEGRPETPGLAHRPTTGDADRSPLRTRR